MTLAALRADARACFDAAVAAVEPGRRVAAALRADADGVALAGDPWVHRGPVVVLGGGKAALPMARAAAAVLGARCAGGVVVVPHGGGGPCPAGIAVETGAHPVPDASGAAATARLLACAAGAGPDTVVLVVLSGGASALLVAPADGLALADKQAVTRRLLAAGADIQAFNAIRKHCSRIKGGGLLRAAAGAAGVWTLVLSDVVGDDPATIASGPTVADATTFSDATAALARLVAPEHVPPAVAAHLARGLAGGIAETLASGDPLLTRARTRVVGGNRDAVRAAATAAAERGYATTVVEEPVTGDAEAAAGRLVACLRALPRDRPVALVAGGETTVRVVGSGRGGRSQHLALAAAVLLAGERAVLLAAGTDGIDGADAAGACVDGDTAARARARGLDPAASLAATDSGTLLAATGDLVVTGPTGTNVADLVVTLRGAC